MQNYLKPNRVMITQNEIQTMFKLRSRVTDVKQNFKAKYENLECRNCLSWRRVTKPCLWMLGNYQK